MAQKAFIIQGRQKADQLEVFLESIGLEILRWRDVFELAAQESDQPNPETLAVVKKGIEAADLVIGLLTPDDEVRLFEQLHNDGEQVFDIHAQGQARPNVLIEVGWALGARGRNTVIVQIGKHRSMTDLGGLQIIELNQGIGGRQLLIQCLKAAGATLDLDSDAWKSAGNFVIDEPITPYEYSPFQGQFRGAWHIKNYEQFLAPLKEQYRLFVSQAQRQNQALQLNSVEYPPSQGTAQIGVFPDGEVIGHLQHGTHVGKIYGSVSVEGVVTATVIYPEGESKLTGSVARNSMNQISANLEQLMTVPGFPQVLTVNLEGIFNRI